jgi:hypothetical protein
VIVDPLSDRREVFLSPQVPAPAEPEAPRAPLEEQPLGDYATTRAGLLHRLALTAPEWQERSEADPSMVLVELLAWAGDQLAAYQDAVATEAWLTSARQPLSIRRHARLLGYAAHDGCNARAWVRVSPAEPLEIGAGACFATRQDAEPGEVGVRTFRALGPAGVTPALDQLELYGWGLADWTLPAGSTELTLEGDAPGLTEGALLGLPGPHVARIEGLQRSSDPVRGVEITRVVLFAEDALPAPLVAAGVRVSANVLLVGEGSPFELSEPPSRCGHGSLSYPLRGRRLAHAAPFDPGAARGLSAAHALRQDPGRSLVDLDVLERRPGGKVRRWRVCRDLLHSGPYDRDVVAELTEHELILRFGDGTNGRPAPPASLLIVRGREVGTHKEAATPGTRLYGLDAAVLADVRVLAEVEPIPPMRPSEVRLRAPEAASRARVCRIAEDYARRVREMDDVLDAHAEIRWTGSWYTVYVWVLPAASDTLGAALSREIRRRLDPVRMLGVDLDVRAPRYVFADIALAVQLGPGSSAPAVKRALSDVLGPSGCFTRASLRLGGSVAQGALLAAASRVRGVRDVRVLRFRRADGAPAVADWIEVRADEVVRVGVGGAPAVELEIVSA